MNKYRISKSVDAECSTSIMTANVNQNNIMKFGMLVFPVVGVPVAGALLLNELANKDVTEISTLDELNEYSCVGDAWNKNCIYVEHPAIPKRLIEARLYRDYILKEIMAEIFDYITDNMAVKKVVLGLESKGKFKAGANVPINELVVDATIAGSLNSNYIYTAEAIDCTNDTNKEYPWLKYYPDVVSAVQKKAGKLEIKQCVKLDLDVNLGIQGVMQGAFKSEKEYNFYVYYERA